MTKPGSLGPSRVEGSQCKGEGLRIKSQQAVIIARQSKASGL